MKKLGKMKYNEFWKKEILSYDDLQITIDGNSIIIPLQKFYKRLEQMGMEQA